MQRDEGDSLRKGRLEKLNRRLARYVDKMRQLLIDRVRELDDSLTQFEFARLLKDLGIPEADAVQVFVFVDTDEDQKNHPQGVPVLLRRCSLGPTQKDCGARTGYGPEASDYDDGPNKL